MEAENHTMVQQGQQQQQQLQVVSQPVQQNQEKQQRESKQQMQLQVAKPVPQPEPNELRNYNSVLSLLSAAKGRQVANDLVDDLLKSIGPKVKLVGLDPMKLPERSVEFEKQICCKTYPGVAELKNGVWRGLSTARRHGEIGLNVSESIEITFSVRLGPMSVTFDSDVTLRNHVYHPTLTATTEFMDVLLHMAFNTNKMTLELRSLKITELDAVTVKVTNMSFFLRFLVKPVANHLVSSEKSFFIAKVNDDFKENIKGLAENALNIKRMLPSLFDSK